MLSPSCRRCRHEHDTTREFVRAARKEFRGLYRALARVTGWPVILLIGVPAYRACHQLTPTCQSGSAARDQVTPVLNRSQRPARV